MTHPACPPPDSPAGLRRRELQLGAAAALLSSWALPACARATPAAIELQPVRAVEWRSFLGVNAQFSWFPQDVARRHAAALKQLGLEWVRLGLHWMLLEPEPGQYKLDDVDRMMSLVDEAGFKSITTVVGTPRFASSAPAGDRYADKYPPREPTLFAQRMALLATRYPGVDVWQVWNEPNIPGFWLPKSDPEGYARLLAPSVVALRSVAPNKPVAMAGMAYYSQMYGRDGLMLEQMGRLGAYGLDLIAAYHPYTAEPEGADDGSRDFLTHAPFVNRWLRAAGVKQIWATEWGWSSYAGPKEEQPIVGEQGQADYTLRRLALMAALDFDRIFLFTLADLDERAGGRDRYYGLLRANGDPKPVYVALARFLATTGPRLEPAAPPRIEGGTPKGLVSIGWKRADGKRLWMAWADQPTTVRLTGIKGGTLHHPLTGGRMTLTDAQAVAVPVQQSLQIFIEA